MSRYPITLLLAFLLGCAIIACAATASKTAKPAELPARDLQIEAPEQSRAGTPLQIVVRTTPLTATSPILLMAQGTFGLYPQRQMPVNGSATFTLPALQTQYAGMVQLTANDGAAKVQATLEILPGAPADPVLPLIGPRSIVADGKHWTVVVASVRDRFLNPVVDNTVVTLRVQHPLRPGADPITGYEIVETRTQHLVAWQRIYSRTQAGEMRISVDGGKAHSPERTVREVPGRPVPFALSANPLSLPADGRQLIQLQSEQIVDRFGNVLLDGSSVTVLAEMGDADHRSLPAITVDGRIYTTLQAPAQPGQMTVRAWIAGISSRPLQLTFTPGPAVKPIALTVQIDAQAIVLVAGPLIGQLEQFIPDGTEVTFTLKAPDGQAITSSAPADYGYATLHLHRPGMVAGNYTVTATVGTGTGQVTFQLS